MHRSCRTSVPEKRIRRTDEGTQRRPGENRAWGFGKYTSVLFCGSGTINIDACISSLLPEGGKVLVVDNGAYSTRAVEVCQYYGLPYIDLKFPVDELPDLEKWSRP